MVGTLEQALARTKNVELMKEMLTLDRPYTVTILAERWQCSAQHIRNMINKGELSCFRAGRLIRILASEVERVEGNTH